LYTFIDDGIDIFHRDVEGAFWTEVDHLGDYDRLTTWVSNNRALKSWVEPPLLDRPDPLPVCVRSSGSR